MGHNGCRTEKQMWSWLIALNPSDPGTLIASKSAFMVHSSSLIPKSFTRPVKSNNSNAFLGFFFLLYMNLTVG